MSAAALSPEIWSHVLSFCVETAPKGSDKKTQHGFIPQKALAAALRVNSTFYLAAAPHLYRSPVVVNIASFLLGADRPTTTSTNGPSGSPTKASSGALAVPAAHAHIQSDLSSIKSGNTKLPLLRHVKNLAIVYERPSPPKAPAMPVPASARKSGVSMAAYLAEYQTGMDGNLAQLVRMNKVYAAATRTLQRLPFRPESDGNKYDAEVINPMPQLLSVRIGKPRNYAVGHHPRAEYSPMNPDEMDLLPDLERLGPLLSRVCRPRFWCEHIPGPSLDLERPSECADGVLPEVINYHLDSDENCEVVWGTTNRVYLYNSNVLGERLTSEDLQSMQNMEGLNGWGPIDGLTGPGPILGATGDWTIDVDPNASELDDESGSEEEMIGIDEDEDEDENDDDDDDDDGFDSMDEDEAFNRGLYHEDELVRIIADAIEESYPAWLMDACSTKRAVDRATRIEIYGVEKLVISYGNEEEWEDLSEDGNPMEEQEDDGGWGPAAGAGNGSRRSRRLAKGKGKETVEVISEQSPDRSAEESLATKRVKRLLERMQEEVKEEVYERLGDVDWSDGGPTIVLGSAEEAPKCGACGLGVYGLDS